MNNNIDRYLNTQIKGFYKVGMVNPITDEVKWQNDEWNKNLILNVGMDHIAAATIVDQFLYGKSGAGSRPNSISGISSEITQSGETVFLSVRTGLTDFTSSYGTYAASVQVGDMLKYANNSESMVTLVKPDGYNLTVTPSYTFSTGQTFVIWKTSQTGLESQIANSNTYFVNAIQDGTYAGSTTVDNVVTHRRTFDFTTEVVQTTYNELGVGWDASHVFSRIKLSPPFVIDAGYKMRFIYELQTTWTPTSSVYKSAGIGNWPVAPATNQLGTESLQVLKTSTISTVNGLSVINSNGTLDPSFISSGPYNLTMWGSSVSASLATFGSYVNRTSAISSPTTTNFSLGSYTNGNYYIDKTGVFATSNLNSTAIRSIGLGDTTTEQSYAFLFNQSQSKDPTQTLSIAFRYAWSRVLA